MLTVKNNQNPRRKYLVFTSAGDRSCLHRWISKEREYDLFVCYYGDVPDTYREFADFYVRRKGGKFPNLHFVLTELGFRVSDYDAVLIIDDDIELSAAAINKLFAIRESYDLWLLQPAFDRRGKLSFPITRARPRSLLRYTNFVEVTCPLFETSKLELFMRAYDPVLVGWGIDLWFCEVLRSGAESRKVAVVDSVPCINPRDAVKSPGEREIDTLQPAEMRKEIWSQIREKYRLAGESVSKTEYGRVPLPNSLRNLFHSLKILLLDGAYCIYRVVDRYRSP